MKKRAIGLCVWILCGAVIAAGVFRRKNILLEVLPKIETVSVSGFYNGGCLEPRELNGAEREELDAWIRRLSLRRRTYRAGEAPNQIWSGGTSYQFSVNQGELSFSYVWIDRAYIWYEEEWYEIVSSPEPPPGFEI